MVERHYLHDTLLRGYDFTYGPVDAPSINNQWEFTYDLPPLTTAQGLLHTPPHHTLLCSCSSCFLGANAQWRRCSTTHTR